MLEPGFPPEFSSRLPYELSAGLASRGHEVRVVTVHPRRHAVASVLDGNRALEVDRGDPRGVTVIRTGFPLGGSSLPARMIENLLVPLFVLFGGMGGAAPDAVHAVSPPLLMGLSCALVARIRRRPAVLRVQDVHPDALVRLGFLKNRGIIAAMERLERLIYRAVDQITVIGDSYARHVTSKGISPERVHVVPNWGSSLPRTLPDDRGGLGWTGKFVVTYAGSISWAQDLETVLEAADRLRTEPRIRFVFVGEGSQKASLQNRARTLGLPNVEFLPLQSRDRHLGILNASDVCLVSLKKRFDSPSVPSKTLDIMACGKPILANVPGTGDLAGLLRHARCGIVIDPEDPEALAAAVRHLFVDRDLSRSMGENGRAYLRAHLSLEQCLEMHERIFSALENRMHPVHRPVEA